MRKVSVAAPPPDWADEIVEPLPSLVTMEETMGLLRCSRRSVTRLIASERLQAVRQSGGGRQLIPRSALAQYLRSLKGAA